MLTDDRCLSEASASPCSVASLLINLGLKINTSAVSMLHVCKECRNVDRVTASVETR